MNNFHGKLYAWNILEYDKNKNIQRNMPLEIFIYKSRSFSKISMYLNFK